MFLLAEKMEQPSRVLPHPDRIPVQLYLVQAWVYVVRRQHADTRRAVLLLKLGLRQILHEIHDAYGLF